MIMLKTFPVHVRIKAKKGKSKFTCLTSITNEAILTIASKIRTRAIVII